ncbi:MAG TPA: VWA domain-containing protein [Bryobacteraceae bacterium]|nr:VWA domain-containing protein [Bryobacteraceae bacterium]
MRRFGGGQIPKLLLFIALSASAQQPEPMVVFKAESNLVIVDVAVKDKAGNPIEGLKKEDFTVLEDGKPQSVSVFEFQKLANDELPRLPPLPPPGKGAPADRKVETITAPSAGTVQYKDKRLLCLFFDMSAMGVPEQLRAQDAALKFLNEQMTSSDLVSIMTFAGGVRVERDFTSDRESLRAAVNSLPIGELADLAGEADNADEDTGEDTGAAFVADETEFNIFNTDRKLAALESAVKKLALLPEKKSFVYFSAGAGKTGSENQSQLQATVNAAVRANVAFYPIDTRGLQALAPGGDASKAGSRGSGLYSGKAQRQQRDRFNDQQETLTSLAADTGGKAFLDDNELSLGVVQAQKDLRSYYILGYYSTNGTDTGRFRRFTVKLAGHPQAKVEYRPGYYGPKEFKHFNAADKERQLTDALSMGDPFTDLRLALEVDYFRVARDRYFVPVSVKVPGSSITLSKKGSSEIAELDFAGQILDSNRKLAGSIRDGIRVKLSEEDAARLNQRSFHYDCGFTLPPGKYRVKMVVRENLTGKIGTFDTRFVIPDLAQADPTTVKMSSVVWANQREPLKSAVGAAEKTKKTGSNPLVQDGQKLVPNVTRVFRKSQSLYVYSEVYEPALDPGENQPSVTAVLSLFRGTIKAFESEPVRLTGLGQHPGTMSIQFQLPLAKLRSGKYTCQLNVIDEVGRGFAYSREPMVLLP